MRERYQRANEGIHAPEGLKTRAARGERPASRKPLWPAVALAAVLIAVVCTAIFWPRTTPGTADEPYVPIYPPGVQSAPVETHPAAQNTVEPPRAVPLSAVYEPDYTIPYDGAELDEAYLAAIRDFAADAGRELLDGDKTTAYSPTTLYTALSMVAELADGSSRAALLDALRTESVEDLRQYSGDLWRYLCADPDMQEPGKVTVANSLWLNGQYNFNSVTLKSLADHYYVSGHIGDMQNEIPAEVSAWVREQTHGLLDCRIEPTEDTMAVLLSAIYFYDEWAEQFDKCDVTSGAFWKRPPDTISWETEGPPQKGRDFVRCMYMERTEEHKAYYKGRGVTASVQYFRNGGKMLFILPDTGKSPADVLSDTALLTSLLNWEGLEKRTGTVEWDIPQFTLSDTIDLADGLTALGLGELFDRYGNPLPLLSDETGAYISQAQQGTAISIDEVGCEAASYVEMMVDAAADIPGEDTVCLYLTRPFVFAILSDNDVPLFLGAVSDPNG